ncbi:hypothetical protein ACFL1G_02320 [Planctomycetota bacterium]
MFDFFEQPWTLIVSAILVLLVILGIRSAVPEKRRWWQWLPPVIIAVAAFGLDFLVTSDPEQIRDVIKKVAEAVKEENTEAIEILISENYRDSKHRSKPHFIAHCKARLSKPLIEKNITRIVSLELDSQQATVVFTARLIFDKRSLVYQNFMELMLIKGELQLRKEVDKGWLINRVEIKQINLHSANWQDIG